VIGAELEPTDHPAVLRAVGGFQRWAQLEPVLKRLEASVSQHDARGARDRAQLGGALDRVGSHAPPERVSVWGLPLGLPAMEVAASLIR